MNDAVPSPPPPDTPLDLWVNRVRHEQMPVFDQTVQNVLKLAQDEMASAAELAKVVLRDASMTARVLKLVNSVHYSHYNLIGGASTVSRAIIVLGFNAVRNIALAVTLVDELVKGPARQRLLRELGQAFHASVQARGLALDRQDPSPEEIFIATLLHRVGELAFWCRSGAAGEVLEKAIRQPGADPAAAQEQVLGFRLDQLNRALAREWSLNGLLLEAIQHPASRDPRIQTVVLGDRIAHCAQDKGWQSSEMDQLLRRAASLSGCPARQIGDRLAQRARESREMVAEFGARQAAGYIALPGQSAEPAGRARTLEADPPEPPAPAAVPSAPHPWTQPDGKLQLRILRELSLLLEEGQSNFNLIMEMVLEGIYRGVGMDRVLFALITPDKRGLRAKYALGEDNARFVKSFSFTRLPDQPHLLFQVMEQRQPLHFEPPGSEAQRALIPGSLIQTLGRVAFLVAPLIVANQCIGLLYADRGPSGRPLDDDDFESFKHFAHQGNLCLTLAAARRRTG